MIKAIGAAATTTDLPLISEEHDAPGVRKQLQTTRHVDIYNYINIYTYIYIYNKHKHIYYIRIYIYIINTYTHSETVTDVDDG